MIDDNRKTLTPPGARITVAEDGFTVTDPIGQIAHVRWRDLSSVHAYTRFIDRRGSLCLDFRFAERARDDDGVVVVNENVSGWNELVSALEQALPGVDPDWFHRASGDAESRAADEGMSRIVPKFLSRWTNVWSRLPIE